jgi:hypothetical protein
MFNYVPIKGKQMSFVSNGGKFKLYTVLNGSIFPKHTQPGILFQRTTELVKDATLKYKKCVVLFRPCGTNKPYHTFNKMSQI